MVNSTINPKLLEKATTNVKKVFPSTDTFDNYYEVSTEAGFDMSELFHDNEVGCVIEYVEEADLPKLYAEVPKMVKERDREGIHEIAILWFFDANGELTRARPMPIAVSNNIKFDLTNGGMTPYPDYILE